MGWGVKMQLSLKSLLQQTINIIFPAKCVNCHALVSEAAALCSDCWRAIEFITEPQCELCGFPFDFNAGRGVLCAACNQDPPAFNKAISIFKYSDESKSLILKLKYKDQLHLAQFFARLIANKLQDLYEYRLVIPVPLHAKRMRQRLYNQSALIASQVAKIAKLDFLPNVLMKTRYDIPQSHLSGQQRRINVLRSFAVKDEGRQSIEGKNLILIDDVYTTGSTVNECSKALKKAGCAKILVITVARVATY